MGTPGSGKTTAISTLIDAGLDVFALFTEPGMESCLRVWKDANRPVPENFHYAYAGSTAGVGKNSFASLSATAKLIATSDFEKLAKSQDTARRDRNRYLAITDALGAFVDQRGVSFGDLANLPNTAVIVIDGLTELTSAITHATVGNKPALSQPDWMVMQNVILEFIRFLTHGTNAHVVVLAHTEVTEDPLTGARRVFAMTPGKKLAATLPALFSDVIHSVRSGKEFYWETADPTVLTKARNVPISAKLQPSFVPLISTWKKIYGTTSTESSK